MKAVWVRDALSSSALDRLDAIGESMGKPGARIWLDVALRKAIAPVDDVIRSQHAGMQPVRVVTFDKSAAANWALPWHQDRVIAVRQRAEMAGFTNWSCKNGTWHCEPPTHILENMLFVRVHLDDATADQGAMEFADGSADKGLIPADLAAKVASHYPSHICSAERGDILILPMLTLHRSIAATKPARRRVLRIDYAASQLPHPLTWAN